MPLAGAKYVLPGFAGAAGWQPMQGRAGFSEAASVATWVATRRGVSTAASTRERTPTAVMGDKPGSLRWLCVMIAFV
jgi:hypothetical protein